MATKTIFALDAWKLHENKYDPAKMITPELAMFIATEQSYFGWYLPTEMVIRSPQYVVPKQAMYYPVDKKAALALTGLTFTEHTKLIQLWEGQGDDGLTEYTLRGYMLLSAEDFDLYLEHKAAHNNAKTHAEYYALDKVTLMPPTQLCSACGATTKSADWIPDTPDGYPRCPNCSMC